VDEYFKELFMKQQVDIFLFVNPLSGGRQGQKFLDMGFKKLQFDLAVGAAEFGQDEESKNGLATEGVGSVHVNFHIV
jgi:hypothetical protein